MAAQLNHTIVWCRDQKKSSAFLTEILDLPPPRRFSHFDVVDLGNGVSLDFADHEGPIARQHYAFLVDDAGFDHGMAVIARHGLTYWADPTRKKAGEINRLWGGRGVYFEDADGHVLELITKPYGAEEDA